MKKIPLIFGLFFILFGWGQTKIKVVFYNVLDYPEAPPANRATILKSILDDIQPDIFMVAELQSEAGADEILNTSLQRADNRYARAAFVVNQSGSSPGTLQQLIFYNTQKLLFTGQSEIITTRRDINHYTFTLKTENMATNPLLLDVFVAHLKSLQGGTNEAIRLDMVLDFTTVLGSIPNSHFVLFGGDFNIYKDTEAAYQELLDTSNAIVMVDPINRPGNWHVNSSFEDIHTQSTRSYSFTDGLGNFFGAGGNLDDRFDFILMSENLQSSSDLYYISGSYKAYGNNGNCFDKSITDISCAGFYSQTIRENLFNMSDHLPVVMELETPENTLAIENITTINPVFFIKGNLVSNWLELQLNSNLQGKILKIYNQLGQGVLVRLITDSNNIKYNVNHLKPGVYYIKIDNITSGKPLKFIKLP